MPSFNDREPTPFPPAADFLPNPSAAARGGRLTFVNDKKGLRVTTRFRWIGRADRDLDAGVVIVHQSLARDENRPYLKSTKTKRPRTLDMPAITIDALSDHRKRGIEERLLMSDRWPVEWSDLVFVSEAGTPLIPSNLRRLVTALGDQAGIEGKLTPYDLRHSATSLLSASGVAPEVLADLLGHVDTRMVHKHYRHPVTPTISVARDRIEVALKV